MSAAVARENVERAPPQAGDLARSASASIVGICFAIAFGKEGSLIDGLIPADERDGFATSEPSATSLSSLRLRHRAALPLFQERL